MAWRKLDKKESCSMTISELLLLIGFHDLIGSVLFMFNIWSKSCDKNWQDEEKTSLRLIMKILHLQVKLKFLLSSKNKIVWWENLKCANGWRFVPHSDLLWWKMVTSFSQKERR